MENTTTANGEIGFMIGVILGMIGITFVITSYLLVAFLIGRIFKKAGKQQWPAYVPIYNHWKLLELGDQSGFWALLAFIPYVNVVSLIFTYIAMHHIGLKLDKAKWFVVVAIFLPLIWFIWLAFDDSKWPEPKAKTTKKKTPTKKTQKA